MKRIAHLTDIHLDEAFPLENGVNARQNWEILLADVAQQNIDEVIFAGDIGGPSAHEYFFASLKTYAPTLKITLGNHDTYSEVINHYHNEFLLPGATELYYSYQDDYFTYLFLDSSADAVSETQLLWLMQELQTSKNILLFIHHPVLPVNTPADTAFPLQNRAEIKDILLETKKEVTLFCGHYHLIDEQKFQNITQYITPAGSFQLVKNAPQVQVNAAMFGYRIITVNAAELSTEVVLFPKD